MARPPKYASEEDKPVSVTLRLPRDLYDQAQQHAKRRQTTLTELVREGLQMRLETPTDPRDILATQDITVMQELEQMIDARVYTILATEGFHASAAAPASPVQKEADKSKTPHYSNTIMPISEATPTASTGRPAPDTAPARRGGRPRSERGQQILTLLAEHPEGLSAEQIRGHTAPDKPIGDLLRGMERTGVVRVERSGKALRYFLA
jgi:hypothetical protein